VTDMAAILERDLNPPETESISFARLREHVMDALEGGRRYYIDSDDVEHDIGDIIDEIEVDIERQVPLAIKQWTGLRDDTAEFGHYMDNLIEKAVNENCKAWSE